MNVLITFGTIHVISQLLK